MVLVTAIIAFVAGIVFGVIGLACLAGVLEASREKLEHPPQRVRALSPYQRS